MDVVGRLRRRPHRELAVRAEVGDRGVLLEREMRRPLVEEEVVVDAVGDGESLLGVAELHRDELVEVAAIAVVVDPRLGTRDRVVDRAERRQGLVLHLDGFKGVEGGVLVDRRHGRDGIPDVADPVGGERVLVLRDRQDPEGDRQIAAGCHRDHTGRRESLRRVDTDEPRVGDRRAEQLAVEHPRQEQVVGELRLPRHLRGRVDLRIRPADDASSRSHLDTGRSPDSSKSVP